MSKTYLAQCRGQSDNRCSTTAQLSTRHVHAAISCAVALNVNASVQALGHRRRGAHNVCLEVGECRHSPHGRVNVDESIHAARKRQSADSWEGKDRASRKALIAEVCVEDGATSVTAAVAVAEQRRRVQKGGVSGACTRGCLAVRTLMSAGTGLWAAGSTQGSESQRMSPAQGVVDMGRYYERAVPACVEASESTHNTRTMLTRGKRRLPNLRHSMMAVYPLRSCPAALHAFSSPLSAQQGQRG